MSKLNLKKFTNNVRTELFKRSPQILMGIGIGGMVTSTVLAVKATPKALILIEESKREKQEDLTTVETVKVAWKPYIPAIAIGTISIGCLIGSHSVSARRTTAIATAYKLSEAALNEYKDVVMETVGEKKEKAIKEKIAEKRLETNPVNDAAIIVTGDGNTLCYDSISGRYFKSSIDKIKRAESEINRRMSFDDYVSLNSFYDEIDLEHIEIGSDLGWNISKDGYLEIGFTSHIAKNNEPAIVLDYEVMPKYDYDRF